METLEENEIFSNHPLCKESLHMTIQFYKAVGYSPPWIGYYVQLNNELVAAAGFKGRPIHGAVEIAYGTFEKFQRKGIATAVCKKLVKLSLKTDPTVRITARTVPENNFSTRVFEKNDFVYLGVVQDPDDGAVWEWEYRGIK